MDISNSINILGEDREHYFNAVVTPIMQTNNYAFKDVETMRNSLPREPHLLIKNIDNALNAAFNQV
jgi:hypothetical protein